MRQEIKLFISDKEVHFSEPPEINFVYQRVDYTNPTLVKNSYTKTLTIQGTPENNKIFKSIFLLDRVQGTGDYFNPSQRVPFQLFENGDLLAEGYCRLDRVKKDGAKIEYDITLFGGLGDFFYSLSYSDSDNPDTGGENLTLADLTYKREDNQDVIDLDFDINRDTVKAAWDRLAERPGVLRDKFDIINFIPAYNGKPDKLDSSKFLIDTRDTQGITLRQISGNTVQTLQGFPTTFPNGYSAYKGRFGFVEGDKDLMEWECRDLRSYLQRPCMSIKGLFNGIENSTKYTLDLDKSFFRYDNPYYEEAYFTLPLLSNLETESEEVSTSFSIGDKEVVNYYDFRYRLEGDVPLYENVSNVSITFTPTATYRKGNYDEESEKAALGTRFYPAFWTGGQGGSRYKYGGLTAQLIGFDNNGNAVAGSDVYVCTNKIYKGGEYKSKSLSEMNFQSLYNSVPIFDYGYFVRGSRWSTNAWDCVWYKPITLNLSITSTDVRYVVLRLAWINSNTGYRTCISPTNGKPNNIFHAYNYSGVTTNISSSNLTVSTPTDTRSGAHITKKKLLGNFQKAPCELLLSYCKLFNLYFEKDLYSDVIHIRHRSTFYDGKMVNLEKHIDRGKEMEISPLSFENKWYAFAFEESDAENIEKYKQNWGGKFGQAKVDTGYNFDNSINELLEGNAFKNGVSVLEQSPYYAFYRTNGTDTKGLPPFLNNTTIKYSLFNNVMENMETTLTYPEKVSESQFSSLGNFYDAMDKLQLHSSDNGSIDGDGVLVFFCGENDFADSNGDHILPGTDIPLTYRLTDDLQEMYDLNGKACWLYTNDDTLGIPITKVPHFSRYTRFRDMDFKYIGMTWDFGFPSELYIPEKKYTATSTIYSRFWKGYISDLYNVNSRILSAYVKLDGKVIGDWLKHFYWFDNSIWVLTKITDYNITSFDTVKCEFAKVWDRDSYIAPLVFAPVLTLTPSINPIPASGGTMDIEVYISDGGVWGTDFDPSIITSCDPVRSTGGTETTICHLTIAPNGGVEREITFTVESTDNQATAVLTQLASSNLGISPSTLTFDYDTGSVSQLNISSPTNYNITITDN